MEQHWNGSLLGSVAEVLRWAGTLTGSKRAFEQALVLPLHHELTPRDQQEVASAVQAALAPGVQSCAG